MSDEYLTDEQEQYYRYNPKIPVAEYKDKWNRSAPSDPAVNREPPGPFLVQAVDSFISFTSPDIQAKWAEIRKFIIDPGDVARLRAAADAWCPDGKSSGTGSVYGMIDQWKRELHNVTFELGKRWTDSAAEALDSYMMNKVDVYCLDPVAEHCEKVAVALRAKADAQDAMRKGIDDAERNAGLGAAVSMAMGLGALGITTYVTGGTGAPVAVAAANAAISPVISGFVLLVFSEWRVYNDFVKACEASLDKLGVDAKKLGVGNGRWPRPWSR